MFIPPTSIDILYEYTPLFQRETFCRLPPPAIGKEVAIVGAGLTGISAAHELLKIGLKPVIFEARNRMGGRLYSMPFQKIQEENRPFAEMGAMRIPYSSHIFLHYAKKLNLVAPSSFPNPGEINTAIYHKNKLYTWRNVHRFPKFLSRIRLLWDLFINPLVNKIHKEWENGNLELVRELWQVYINQYKNMSLYQAIIERSALSQPQLIDILGAIGIGHGGLSSLFDLSFLEMLRLLVNGYIGEDLIIAEGMSEFIRRLYELKVQTPFGLISLADTQCVHLNRPVVLMDYNKETGNPIVFIKSEGKLKAREFPAVIFSGPLGAAQLTNITNKTNSGVYLLSSEVREGIKTSPMIASSKTYICTETKFWLKKKIPYCILSDDITRATYFLDYPNTKYGVVCLSYTWALDSIKLQAIDPKDRVVIFKRSLSAIYKELNDYLVPVNGEVLSIDWGNEPYQNGAFKVFNPGDDRRQKPIYLQFLSVLGKEDKGVYLAGDSVSWSGGWVEGAVCTAINAVYAVAKRLGAEIPKDSPLSQDSKLYKY
jgi:tryptophan 2-monooxygenase